MDLHVNTFELLFILVGASWIKAPLSHGFTNRVLLIKWGHMGLPAQKTESSVPEEKQRLYNAIISCLEKGMRPNQIAALIAGKGQANKARRNMWRVRIWKMLEADPQLQAQIAARAQAEMALALVPSIKRLGKRAARLGKPAEIKLLAEMSGFHNPRVKHEHSGDINVNLNIPRPEKLTVDPDEVVDAEVVDE